MEAAPKRRSYKYAFLKSGKSLKNTCEGFHFSVKLQQYFSRVLQNLEVTLPYIFKIQNNYFQGILFSRCFCTLELHYSKNY